jgi:hypothetical protein
LQAAENKGQLAVVLVYVAGLYKDPEVEALGFAVHRDQTEQVEAGTCMDPAAVAAAGL